jgi:putative aldouronate transport system substrate-binding protein
VNRRIKLLLVLLPVIVALSAMPGYGKAAAVPSKQIPNLNISGFPIVRTPIKLKIVAAKSAHQGPWDKMLAFTEYQKMTKIETEFQLIPEGSGWKDRLSVMLASGEIPDAFVRCRLGPSEISRYGEQGILIPLEKLIPRYAPNFQKILKQYPEVKKSITAADGHIYTLPIVVTVQSQRTGNKPWLNKVWLDKLGLKVPQTTDELLTVLRAFRDKDPNGNGKKDEIPLTARGIDEITYVLAGAWGLPQQMRSPLKIVKGKVHFWYADPRYKELLMYLNTLYKEGLIDQEIFTHSIARHLSKLNSSQSGMFFIVADDVWSKYSNDYTGMAPLKGPHGDRILSPVGPIAHEQGSFAISRVNKYPEATLRWVDYFYSREGSILISLGVEGKTYIKKPDGTLDFVDEVKNDSRGLSVAMGQFSPRPGGGFPHSMNEASALGLDTPNTRKAQEFLNPYMPKEEILSAPIFDKATYQRIGTILTDYGAYVAEAKARFITGQWGFDKWDEYIQTLDKIGIKELEKAYQEAYDRMKRTK